jgi:hypothetical protein
MSDWQIVDGPVMPPHKCICCPSFKDKVIDTKVDIVLLPDGGRVYICRNCARQAAVLFGFAKGEKAEKLQEAAVMLDETRKELANAKVALREAHTLVSDANTARKHSEEELARERQKVDQLRAAQDEVTRVLNAQKEATA